MHSSFLRSWLWPCLGALLGFGACADDPTPRPPSVELGTGETAFEPVMPAAHLAFHAGTQGGHHVWLSYRVFGLLPQGIRMELDVVPEPPARPAHTDVLLDLTQVPSEAAKASTPETYEFVGWPAQVLDPECAVGKSVTLTLKLTDTAGLSVEGSLEVIPDPPALGFAQDCTL